MTNYRRLKSPGSTYFFTLCAQEKGTAPLIDHIDLLRHAWRKTFAEFPAIPHAVVILPDHMHVVLTEPEDEVNFSERWRRFKSRVSHSVPENAVVCDSKRARRERGFWQRRFWEHRVRDEADFRKAVDYCRTDPSRHGLVGDSGDWPYSSFRKMGNIAHPT